MKWQSPTLDFRAGVLGSGSILLRDKAPYYSGVKDAVNVWPTFQGGLKPRPGLAVLGRFEKQPFRLAAFEFGDGQRYVVVFGHLSTVIYTEGWELVQEIDDGFEGEDLPILSWVQSGDTMIICCGRSDPFELRRVGFSSFEYRVYEFDRDVSTSGDADESFRPLAPWPSKPTVALWLDHVGGPPYKIRAASDFFDTDWVGRSIFFYERQFDVIQRVGPRELLVTSPNDDFSGDNFDPTFDWQLSAFGGIMGYPRNVAFDNDRLWFFATDAYPNGVWASQIGSYRNFRVNGKADGGIFGLISDDETPFIQQVAAGPNRLFAWSSKKLHAARQTQNGGIDATDFGFPSQVAIGARAECRPAFYDGVIWFAGTNGQLYVVGYDDSVGGYVTSHVSLLAPELVQNTARLAVYRGNRRDWPENLLFALTDDGALAICRADANEKINQLLRWETRNGLFRDVCVVGDQVFFHIERGEFSSIEALDMDRVLDASVLRSDLDYAEANGGEIDWTALQDQLVRARIGDGLVITETELETAMEAVPAWEEIGLPIDCRIEPLPPDGLLAGAPLHGKTRRIVWLAVEVEDVTGLEVDGKRQDARVTDENGIAERRTGTLTYRLLGFSRARTPEIVWTQPFGTVIGYTMALDVGSLA